MRRGRPIVIRAAVPASSGALTAAGSASVAFTASARAASTWASTGTATSAWASPTAGSFLYVDATVGNDARTRAQAANPATPWASIGRAVWGSTVRSSPNTSQAAQAGDTVLVQSGTYWASPQCANSLDVWYTPANAGTVGAPITIRAQGTVHLAASGPRACGPLIGSSGRSYITWEGFTVEEDAAPPCGDSGAFVVADAIGCRLQRSVLRGSGWARRSARTGGGGTYHELILPIAITSSTAATPTIITAPTHGIVVGAFNDHAIRIDGHSDTLLNGEWYARALTTNTFELHRNFACTDPVTGVGGTGGLVTLLRLDNHSLIFTSGAHQLRVSDCHLSRSHGYGENSSGAILYTTWGAIFENCECEDFEGYGIFFKGMDPAQVANADLYGPTIVRDCYIHHTQQGGIFQGDLPCTDANRLLVYRNLITNDLGQGRGFQCLGLTDAARAPRNAWIVNNVFDNCQAGIVLRGVNDAAAGFHSQGNIVVSCDRAFEWWLGSTLTAARFDVEHDVIFGNTNVMVIDPEGAATTYATVAAFQSAYPHVGGATPAIATTDPLFTNPATRDYTLQGGSPALNRSRSSNGLWGADGTIIHAGLYPTTEVVIGRSTYALPSDRMTLWKPGVTYNGGIPARATFTTLTPTGTTDTAQIQAAVNACPVGQAVELAAGTFTLAAGTWIDMKSGVTIRGQGDATILTRTATDLAVRKWPDAYIIPAGGHPFFVVGPSKFPHWRVASDAVNLQVTAEKGAYAITVDPTANLTSRGIVVGAHVVIDEDHFYTGAWATLPLSNGATNPWQVWQSDRVTWSRFRRWQGPQAVASSNAATNRFTVTGHPFQAGDGIYLTGHSATLSPAYTDGRYSVASGAGDDPDANTFKLRVWGGASHGTLVDITTGGTGGTAEAYMLFTDFDPGPTSTIAAYGGSGEQPGNALGWFGRGGGRYWGQVNRIRAITGNVIEFESPLHSSYRVSHAAQICAADAPIMTDVGIESMAMVGGSDGAIQFLHAAKSWAKNVRIQEWLGHAVEMKMAYQCEVTGSYLHDAAWPVPGGAGYGVVFSFHASECLLEDTAIIGANKLVAGNSGGTGCVVASCYLDDSMIWTVPQASGSGTWVEVGGNVAHNNSPHHALITDCDAHNHDSDMTHGSSSDHTHYRNRGRGFRRNKREDAGNNNRRCIGLGAGTRRMSFVGNVLGEAGRMAGWIYEVPSGVVFNSQPDAVMKFQYSTGDWNQYRWDAAHATTVLVENYDYLRVQRNNPTLQTLPDSLYAPGKPAYYGATTWPPANPLTGAMATIPALARYNALHPGQRQWTNFNMPDGVIDGDWTIVQGGWQTVANRLRATALGHNTASHSYMTMGANQYAEVRIVASGAAPPTGGTHALQFYGEGNAATTDKVYIPCSPADAINVGQGDFTIELWCRMPATLQNGSATAGANYSWIDSPIVFDRDLLGSVGSGGDFGISVTNGRITFGIENSAGSQRTLIGTTDLRDDRRHHIAVTRVRSSGDLAIYVDGVREAFFASGPSGDVHVASNSAASTWNRYICLGGEKHALDWPQGQWRGWIDEVRISSSIRYTGTSVLPPVADFVVDGSTVGLYRCNDGTGTTLTDASGNANHGTLVVRTSGSLGPTWQTESWSEWAGGEGGPAVRIGAGPTYYYATLSATACRIRRCLAGVHTTLPSGTFAGIGTSGRIARLSIVGTTLTLRYDGSVVGSVSDGGIAGGLGGVYHEGPFGVYDDFAWGEL